MKRLIVSADDFGRSVEINAAIERAHTTGVLRAASLMVAGPAATDAIERAKRLPGLAVGLHVVLAFGTPVLAKREIPDLLESDGAFPNDLFQAGVRYFFRPGIRAQLRAEIRAQFERFADTGLQLDHVNAQSHLHVHPTVFATILEVGREHGLRAIRIPSEPIGAALHGAGDRLGMRLGYAAVAGPWLALMRARTKRAGVLACDAAFGVNDAGAMTTPRVLRLLERVPEGLTEMFFHPATGTFGGPDPGTAQYAWTGELEALTSPAVAAALVRNRIAPTTYGEAASQRLPKPSR